MIHLHIDKTLVTHFVDAISTGNAVEVPPEQWNDNELLVLAGCCLALVTRQNSELHDGQRQQSAADQDPLTDRQRIRECKTAIDVVRELVDFSKYGTDWDNYLKTVEEAIVDHSRFGDGGFRYVDSANRGTNYFD